MSRTQQDQEKPPSIEAIENNSTTPETEQGKASGKSPKKAMAKRQAKAKMPAGKPNADRANKKGQSNGA